MIEGTIDDLFPSKYLKASDIKGTVEVTIKDMELEQIGDNEKVVVYFEEMQKGLVVNKTNSGRITKATGTSTFKEWVGKKLTLYTALVPYRGEDVPAIRVKA